MARYATRKQKPCSKIKKHAKYAVLKSICLEINEASKKNGNRKPYGLVKKILGDMSKDYPWLNRNVINFSYEKYIRNKKCFDPVGISGSSAVVSAKNGRPKGTTDRAKHELKVALRDALNAIAVEFEKEKNIAKALGPTMKRGCLEELISQKRAEYGIPADIKIFKGTIRSRIVREKAIVNGMGPEYGTHGLWVFND